MADIFPPEERGKSMGLLSIPILVGPVVGPLMGGGLAYRLGWRSTFVAMAILGGLIFAGMLLLLEETSHHHVERRLSRTASKSNLRPPSFREPIARPRFELPWAPLVHLCDPVILPSALATIVMFATMFSSLIVMPGVLASPPYRLNEAQVRGRNDRSMCGGPTTGRTAALPPPTRPGDCTAGFTHVSKHAHPCASPLSPSFRAPDRRR